jgi:hypothetical protein
MFWLIYMDIMLPLVYDDMGVGYFMMLSVAKFI